MRGGIIGEIKLEDSHLNGLGSQPYAVHLDRRIWIAAGIKDTDLCRNPSQSLYLSVIYQGHARKLGFSNCNARRLCSLLGYSNEDRLILRMCIIIKKGLV